MGQPVGFDGANFVFRAPEDLSPEECCDLQVMKTDKQIVSCWRLSPAEIEHINETGVVFLNIMGQGMPPVWVGSGPALFGSREQAPKAEPFIPPANRKTST